jgi:glycosyltransferase involved in cell wall biosynthesis
MPAVMAEHDALLLLSEWEEPFARIVLEAMAAGLVVIGSLTGGTPEVLIENETGLTFPRGDANVLANQLQRLFGNPDLVRSLADAGRQRVEERFTFSRMVDQLEDALSSASRKG